MIYLYVVRIYDSLMIGPNTEHIIPTIESLTFDPEKSPCLEERMVFHLLILEVQRRIRSMYQDITSPPWLWKSLDPIGG